MAGLFPKPAITAAALAALLALAGCMTGSRPGLHGGGSAGAAAGEGQITVTALAPLPGAGAAAGDMAPAHLAGPGIPRPRPRPQAAASAPAVLPADAGAPAASAPPVAAEPVPEAAKSPARLACEKRRGQWVETGKRGIFGCITHTKDALKECRSSRECEGQCLARSGTCAPYQPLFGCNEIFDDSGRRMTQCLD